MVGGPLPDSGSPSSMSSSARARPFAGNDVTYPTLLCRSVWDFRGRANRHAKASLLSRGPWFGIEAPPTMWFVPTSPTSALTAAPERFPIPGYTSKTSQPSSAAHAYTAAVFPLPLGPDNKIVFVKRLEKSCGVDEEGRVVVDSSGTRGVSSTVRSAWPVSVVLEGEETTMFGFALRGLERVPCTTGSGSGSGDGGLDDQDIG